MYNHTLITWAYYVAGDALVVQVNKSKDASCHPLLKYDPLIEILIILTADPMPLHQICKRDKLSTVIRCRATQCISNKDYYGGVEILKTSARQCIDKYSYRDKFTKPV